MRFCIWGCVKACAPTKLGFLMGPLIVKNIDEGWWRSQSIYQSCLKIVVSLRPEIPKDPLKILEVKTWALSVFFCNSVLSVCVGFAKMLGLFFNLYVTICFFSLDSTWLNPWFCKEVVKRKKKLREITADLFVASRRQNTSDVEAQEMIEWVVIGLSRWKKNSGGWTKTMWKNSLCKLEVSLGEEGLL